MTKRHNRGDLDRLKQAVVVIALDNAQGPNHFRIAAAIADAPAGHVVALAHRREFDADVFRPRRGKKAGRLIAVECHVGIREVANDHEAVTASQFDYFYKKLWLD